MNPANWLSRAARLWPGAPALLRGETVVADYATFQARAARFGGWLREAGVRPGDRVALFAPNRADYLVVLYGTWMLGAAAVPINAKLHPREVAWMLEHSGAGVVVTDRNGAEGLAQAGVRIVDLDAGLPAGEPLEGCREMAGDSLAWLFYTSGTTGRPKGVQITCGNIMAMVAGYLADVDAVQRADVSLYAAPMSHGAGLYNFMYVIRGARHLVPESGGFDPREIFELGERVGNLCLFAAPTMVRRMTDLARAAGLTGEGIRTVIYGGGPMYVADIIEAVDLMGPRFVQIYGQGECPMCITALPREMVADRDHPDWRARLGSVGFAQANCEVRVVNREGEPVPTGESGEICARGAGVMSGYWQNPEATAETLKDGWLWTGDMGALSEDGFLTLQDRSKDLIISGGTNIYPREVEECLLTHPAVAEASVIGRPDPEWGEVVVACVVRAGTCSEAELDSHCLDRIARFKRPKVYAFVDALPKNAYGKVLKTELRSEYGS
ncbi:putative long-chain-fatty-acid CoA ligase [Pseudooceanicola batsensis HTCC2597]|uniref:3-methylmercaptopropionyl-CoA ligase n=1 Tax=Pseudooceanicola batsensis (strain ATCC BAA-863 / DSM 15984 / KCTC 12145 / HTCC2597) TaxID=252305 RepID=A3U290_PSEBH|nr:AMP-binding protein [Pseudooceanicola batsensis]EAQ01690.1 putative long-chain-fatty-acid CoA ligase [Pseudooceanicola batsensis HTCC2597]